MNSTIYYGIYFTLVAVRLIACTYVMCVLLSGDDIRSTRIYMTLVEWLLCAFYAFICYQSLKGIFPLQTVFTLQSVVVLALTNGFSLLFWERVAFHCVSIRIKHTTTFNFQR